MQQKSLKGLQYMTREQKMMGTCYWGHTIEDNKLIVKHRVLSIIWNVFIDIFIVISFTDLIVKCLQSEELVKEVRRRLEVKNELLFAICMLGIICFVVKSLLDLLYELFRSKSLL